MKKLYKLGLASVLALSLAACSAGNDPEPEDTDPIDDVTTGADPSETEEDGSLPATGGVEEDTDADVNTDLDADTEAETDDADAGATDDTTLEEDADQEQ